jgi:aryl-alcohol dehydrogenase-like predicted oxidoreductase
MKLKTQQGVNTSILGLAAYPQTNADCVQIAFNSGINYFFFYDSDNDSFLEGLKKLLTVHRNSILIATGSESRDINTLRQYLEQVRLRLNTVFIDIFFTEYLSPNDDINDTRAVLDELRSWKQQGLIRYIGTSTHNSSIALQLIENKACDVLMLRYNMAHRKIEDSVLPAAYSSDIPVVAFTCTRWGSLLAGHPNWHSLAPTASDCYRYALYNQAVNLALTAPQSVSQLKENLSVLNAPQLSTQEVQQWQSYGALIYGTGQDAFDTKWI